MHIKRIRTYEIIAGLGFIIATLCYSIGSNITSEIMTNITQNISYTQSNLIKGSILEVINNLSVILVGFMFYLILKEDSIKLAKGYLFQRVLEATLLTIGTSLVWFINYDNSLLISKSYAQLFNSAMLILGVYSSYFFIQLMKQKRGPSWLMVTGVVGYMALTLYAILSLMGLSSALLMLLFIPGGLFELIFPVYLIVKGLKKYPQTKIS